jgi:AraC-like DNA-binding protein
MLSVSTLTGGKYTCTRAWGGRQFPDFHRLYFPIKGQADFTCGTRTWSLRPGHIYLLPGYQWADYGCKGRLELYWMHFRPDAVDMDLKVANLGSGYQFSEKSWSIWKPVYSRLDEFFAEHPPELSYRVQAMLSWAMAEILRIPNAANRQSVVRGLEPLAPALNFMDQHFEEDPSLEDVAAQVHLSPIYFHRLFTQTLHVTPHRYLLRKRMQTAWSLLRNGMSVTEVSDRLHYCNPFYFSRAFRKFFGQPPNQVRQGRITDRP